MTTAWFCGLWHVRRAPLTVVVLAVVAAFVWIFPDVVFGVSTDPFLPARGVSTPHLAYLTLVSILPVLSVPTFGGRELLTGSGPRGVHTAYSMMVIIVPACVVPLWLHRVRSLHPLDELPRLAGLLGLPLDLAALAMISCLVLGRAWGATVPLGAFSLLVVFQQRHPESWATRWFEASPDFHTSWWSPIVALTLAAAVSWRFSSIPRTDRRR